ncbi:hypothetical protein [Acinetobacter sp. CFCC 10889]|uniref:hypothetical protein n=1 Tax=Acinetobacter sp. CFCC 10889 TaxID=1775557 RepID=UPI000DCF88E4|nr:hypothetical protein [Acinetobacter sp. CFCC 10889]
MTKRNCTCDCKELLIELLKSNAEQSRVMAAQNAVMGKIVDQNTELMNQLSYEEDKEPDRLKTLD